MMQVLIRSILPKCLAYIHLGHCIRYISHISAHIKNIPQLTEIKYITRNLEYECKYHSFRQGSFHSKKEDIFFLFLHENMLFVYDEVLQPSQLDGVNSNAVTLPNPTFAGQA